MRKMVWFATALAAALVTSPAASAASDPCKGNASARAKERAGCQSRGDGGAARPGKRSGAPGRGKPAGGDAGSSQAAPGHDKIWICHATGSATNPYVLIYVPPPAVEAHRRHRDGGDIVPAPTGADGKAGCPNAQGALVPVTQRQAQAAARDGKGKAWICHATGSATNPYVLINVSTSAVAAHQRHQDGRDLVPAPTDASGKPACPNAQGALVPATASAVRAVGTTGSTLPATTTGASTGSAVTAATLRAERRRGARTRAARRARRAVRAQGFTG